MNVDILHSRTKSSSIHNVITRSMEEIEKGFDEMRSISEDLLSKSKTGFDDRNGVPRSSGVYALYRAKNLLYIGESNNLRRRLFSQHGPKGRNRSSYFRRQLAKKVGIDDERKLSKLIEDEVQFKFMEVEEDRKRVECFLIGVLDPELNRSFSIERKD